MSNKSKSATKPAKAAKVAKKAPAAKAPRVTNITQMRSFYEKNVLPQIGTVPNKTLRRSFIDEAISNLGTSDASGASMFNTIQKEHVTAGTVKATAVGRGALAVAKEAADKAAAEKAAAEKAAAPGKWSRVDKTSRKAQGTYPSKAAAMKGKKDTETAVLTSSL